MTTHGGGWILVGKIGQSANHGQVGAFDTDLNLGELANGNAPSAALYAHYNLARFNAYGSTWTLRNRVDSNNNGSHYQFTFFRPQTACSPGQAGQNWVGTSTPSRLLFLVMSTNAGLANTTWLPLGRYDSPGSTTLWMFGFRVGSDGSPCLTTAGQTFTCHAPAGTITNEARTIGTMTSAFSNRDGIGHTWQRRGTYWLRNTNVGGTP